MAGKHWRSLILLLAGAAVFFVLFLVKVRHEMPDFEVNYRAGHRLRMGETLYRTEDQHWQFKYSPFSALLYLPLSYVPLETAKGIWYFGALAAMAVIVFVSARLIAAPSEKRKKIAAALAGVVLLKFFLRELQLGQINALITAILMGMTWCLAAENGRPSAGRESAAGFLGGLASALKPYAVIFFPYFIIKRRWRAFASGIVVLALSLVVPVFFYGFQGNIRVIREWIENLSRSTPGLLVSQDNVSLLALLMKWTGNRGLSLAVFAAGIAVLAALTLAFILKAKRINTPVPAECAWLMLLIPLVSPLGWDYTFISAFFAVAVLAGSFSAFPGTGRVLLAVNGALIAFSLYDLFGRRFYAVFMSWSVPTVNFLVLAAALFYLRTREFV